MKPWMNWIGLTAGLAALLSPSTNTTKGMTTVVLGVIAALGNGYALTKTTKE